MNTQNRAILLGARERKSLADDVTAYLLAQESVLYGRLTELYDSSERMDQEREQHRSKVFDARADGEFHRFEVVLAEYERICGLNRGYGQPTEDDIHRAVMFNQDSRRF
jgi:hypothetical protein